MTFTTSAETYIARYNNEKNVRQREKSEFEGRLAAEARIRAEVEKQVALLHVWLKDMSVELKASKRNTQDTLRQKSCASNLATCRLELLRDMKVALNECPDELATELQIWSTLERIQTIQL